MIVIVVCLPGYLVSFVTLNFVVICEIWWELFGATTSYNINLIAVAIVSLGCTGIVSVVIILHYNFFIKSSKFFISY